LVDILSEVLIRSSLL